MFLPSRTALWQSIKRAAIKQLGMRRVRTVMKMSEQPLRQVLLGVVVHCHVLASLRLAGLCVEHMPRLPPQHRQRLRLHMLQQSQQASYIHPS